MRLDQDAAATYAHQMMDQPHNMPLVGGDLNPDGQVNQYSNPASDGLKKDDSCAPFMSNRFEE